MPSWNDLLNPRRPRHKHEGREAMGTAVGRTQIERDFDRVLFATPTRRLADKTQVFPMEENDSIRNRLTHSHEVSNLARSIGVRLAFEYPQEVFGVDHEELDVKRNVPPLLAGVGLAHDLGNPPYGHQGEVAIRGWFQRLSNECSVPIDFLKFDGNAQTFRLLTRLQVLNDNHGLNLTYATLASLLKYPSVYGSENLGGFKKHGVFNSEREIVEDVWLETGLREGMRHPMAYIMEACDDIAYSIIDAEDTVKKGYASFYDLVDYLNSFCSHDPVIKEVVDSSKKQNEEFKKTPGLSSSELNDLSMQMFRVKAIAEMVPAATGAFINRVGEFVDQTVEPGVHLMQESTCSNLCEATKEFDKRYGFAHRDVLHLELKGNNYIQYMMDMLWRAISKDEKERNAFERYAFGEVSENYRRVYGGSSQDDYSRCQLLCDAISGMTEKHLVRKHDELSSLNNGDN